MGETSGQPDEQLVHAETPSAHRIDRTEVTVAAYAACVSRAPCAASSMTVIVIDFYDAEDTHFFAQLCNGNRVDPQQHLVNRVDWTMADAYCRAQGARLPTEAEWEFAARGTDGRVHPWRDQAPNGRLMNGTGPEFDPAFRALDRSFQETMSTDADGFAFTAPVGNYPAGAVSASHARGARPASRATLTGACFRSVLNAV